MGYDFSKINDKEFEILTCNLLSEYLGKRIERFKPGKDSGVDGRFFSYDNNEVIIQCKHYLKSGYNKLITKLKNEELGKVEKLSPSDYILSTTLPLSRANKKEIYQIFQKYMKSENNVYGQEDLDDLLDQFPIIVEKFYKLWFTSTHVLKNLLNAAIKGRSEFEIERITKNAPLYIETEYHFRALEQLKKHHVLIITGEPGIGKTTLAENLCLYFVSQDYEFIDIENSLNEAESVYSRGVKQIFLFDDFLGSNFLEAIENKKDSHIVKFMDRISNDKSKIFILTSRTNILNNGILHSPYFQNSNFKTSEFQLEVSGLTKLDKAKILYNHMWFSKLTPDFLEEIYKLKRYYKIIEHRNYNPRLVSFITDSSRLPVDSVDKYWKYINDSLNNPKDIWSDCFKRQSNTYVRNLVCLCVFNGGTIHESDLKTAYVQLNEIERTQNPSHTMKDFDSMIRLCTKAFLNRNRQDSKTYYSLFNPSLADYIINEFGSDSQKMINIFSVLRTHEAIQNLDSLVKESILDTILYDTIRNNWFNSAIASHKSSAWNRVIVAEHLEDSTKNDKIIGFIKSEILKAPINEDLTALLKITWTFRDCISQSIPILIKRILEKDFLNRKEVALLAPLVEEFFTSDTPELEKFCEQVILQIKEDVEEVTDSMDLSEYIENNYDGDVKFNSDVVCEMLNDVAVESLSNLNCSFLKSHIDLNNIDEDIDYDDMLDNFLKSFFEPDYDYFGRGSGSQISTSNEIDDLFDKQ